MKTIKVKAIAAMTRDAGKFCIMDVETYGPHGAWSAVASAQQCIGKRLFYGGFHFRDCTVTVKVPGNGK